ncbi:acyltransferase family protein [Paracidobacterium acidisoli]|uniref:Acyltransferase n=1 Tax=Paracidobacterium acidisoli TaxID=2303751 RepID=A0A372ITY3_9BACT|nr:acyltransferase [Paracidobacterium acidisoli]MBT9329822.1 acyltransferase [Paracidobacterium acidisoli]
MLKKITGPGLFRLFLALLVFVHHTTRFAIGICAVYIFFCLSGYWIYKMYRGRYAATRRPYLTYLVSRAWRLLPVFALISLLTLLFLYINGTLGAAWNATSPFHFIVSNLFIFGYGTLPVKPIDAAWSLDVEMQFYLVAPLLAALLAWRRVSIGWILLVAAAVSLASVYLHNPVSAVNYTLFFLVGMAAASTDWRPSGRVAVISAGGTALVIFLIVVSPFKSVLLAGAHPGPFSDWAPHANVILALFMAPYAIYTTTQKGFALDGMFADLSYEFYLLHGTAVAWIATHPGGVLHRLITMALSLIAVLAVSTAIWKFYDRPINRMRSRWVSRRKKLISTQTRTAQAAAAEVAGP